MCVTTKDFGERATDSGFYRVCVVQALTLLAHTSELPSSALPSVRIRLALSFANSLDRRLGSTSRLQVLAPSIDASQLIYRNHRPASHSIQTALMSY